jgi:DNA transposition AAA+ family ATPase
MSSVAAGFIETQEYRRFQEFCDACCRDRYIGLCYGPPGVGKTISAQQYATWDRVQAYNVYPKPEGPPPADLLRCRTAVYTPPVTVTPGQVQSGIEELRRHLRDPHVTVIRHEEQPLLATAYGKLNRVQRTRRNGRYLTFREESEIMDEVRYSIRTIEDRLAARIRDVKDPTALIVIDEADRLKMAALEQVRDIFDRGGIGVVLIGMPGIEKRLARYPQLYSRVGFVHEFRPLTAIEVRSLLHRRWCPAGIALPDDAIADEESISSIIRVTGGNFRLLHRLLTQIGRVLEINRLNRVTLPVIEAARESLVIGTA